MSHIEVRPARPEDRDAVLAFCANTWEWGDYIERVWDEWLTNPAGRLLVAVVDERPAGIAHMEMLTPTDAWLEGLRIDPQFRHLGLARALSESLQVEAMNRGALYARLAVESTNTRSIQITESGHWRRVSEFTFYAAPPAQAEPRRRSAGDRPRAAALGDLEMIIDFLNASNTFPLVGGLYHVRFRAYPISDTLLRDKIEAGHVYILHRWDRLDGIAIAEPREEHMGSRLSVGYIDGTAIEPISLLADDLRYRAYAMELEGIRVYAPNLVLVRDAFTGVGYEWEDSVFYVYEKGLV